MAYNPSLKVKSLFGKDEDDDTTEYQNKMTSAFGNNQNQNTNKFLYAPNNVNNLLGNTNDTDESKTKNISSINSRLNPYTDKNGNIKNKYIDYQNLLDRSDITGQAKEWIKQATGLEETALNKNNVNNNVNSQINGDKPNTFSITNGRHGFISAKYETGGWNPGLVSNGSGDYGGVSYGLAQFSTTTGSAASFVKWLKQTNPDMGNIFGGSSPGTAEFGNAWKECYSKYGDKFANAQTTYAYNNMVKPLVNLAKQKTGIDYTSSEALYELIYSTAIQFGGGSLGLSALGDVKAGMSEKDIVNASYDKKINNVSSFFRSSSSAVQQSVANRFKNERNDVLSLVGRSFNRTAGASGSKGQSIVNEAKNYIGTDYVWGGETPSGFDCSGLVKYVYAKNGIDIPRTTYEQVKVGKQVNKSNLQPGDLVFFGNTSSPHHVGIYIGNNQYLHAPKTGDKVKISNLSDRSDFSSARRLVN